MKKFILLSVIATLAWGGASAQSLYEAHKIASRDLTGSARFVGMGGAMGALGGDLSTMSVNPAGTGIYRSGDFAATLSYSMLSASGVDDVNKPAFDNLGLVFAAKVSDYSPVRYVNFGFTYSRRNSFYKNMSVSYLMNGMSMAQQMANQANQSDADYGAGNVFDNDNAGWLAGLGWNSGMLTWDGAANAYKSITDYYPSQTVDAYYNGDESGSINEYAFNLSMNVRDRIYLGMTIGTYDVNYHKYSLYDESYTNPASSANATGFGLESWNQLKGTGFDVKFGMIVRPFEYSPLRLGVAIHTPTFYKLSLYTSARIQSDLFWAADGSDANIVADPTYTHWQNTTIDTFDELNGRDMIRDFQLQTPWVFNLSAGYTIGSNIALGAEYEYEDYSSMKFRYPDDGMLMAETSPVKEMMQGVSTFRVGGEWKIVPEFALRLGYTYSASAFKNDAYKALPYNSVTTDTDFANHQYDENVTLGFGYRGKRFYTDMALKYHAYEDLFYAFDNVDLSPVMTKYNKYQLMLTLGMRF
jgi:hypothetical protein